MDAKSFRPIDLVREDLRPHFESNSHVVEFIAELNPDLAPHEISAVINDYSESLKSLGRTLTKAAPGMLSGAVSGAAAGAAGGLPGILAGAVIGAGAGAATGLSNPSRANRQSRRSTRRSQSQTPSPRRRPVPDRSSGPTTIAPNPALMFSSVIGQPAVRQALAANALLGPYGIQRVNVGGKDFAVSQLITLVAMLAGALTAAYGAGLREDEDKDQESEAGPLPAMDLESAEVLAYLIGEAAATERASLRGAAGRQYGRLQHAGP